jgi:steroid delta-isomerase-like uncharacterized protein
MAADHRELATRWFEEVWNQGRADVIDEMVAPESVVHGLGEDLVGPEGFKVFHAAYRDAFPDVRVQIDDMVAEGDRVVVRWSAAATHAGGGLGIPATGRPVRFGGMTVMRFSNGKLVEGWNSYDQLGLFQQLGVVNLP